MELITSLGGRTRAGLGGHTLVVANDGRTRADTLAVLRVANKTIRAFKGARVASFANRLRVRGIVTSLGAGRIGDLFQ